MSTAGTVIHKIITLETYTQILLNKLSFHIFGQNKSEFKYKITWDYHLVST